LSFDTLKLSESLKKRLTQLGYTKPTEIQIKAIPIAISGKDILAAAQTGTGKTAAFGLPILQRLSQNEKNTEKSIRALIIAPTRELAAQIGQSLESYGKDLSVSTAVVFGGVKINPQIARLRKGVDILVATPGRLLDLYNQKIVNLSNCRCVVLDEADRMLDMGFIHDIRRIFSALPKKRQTLLFSATFSDPIRELGKFFVNNAVEIAVNPNNSTADSVCQEICSVDQKNKPGLLAHLIHKKNWEQVLVFTRTKYGANRLVSKLEREGLIAAAIHGNKSQSARTQALKEFKSGNIRVLVATDIAARGLDIQQLPAVINYELPQNAEDYVHRIGRTGRAGSAGQAISLVSFDEYSKLRAIEKLIQQVLPRIQVDGYSISKELPISDLNRKKIKAIPTSKNGENLTPKHINTKHRKKLNKRFKGGVKKEIA
jgi:ATP-dependent RNA helicase RhlE